MTKPTLDDLYRAITDLTSATQRAVRSRDESELKTAQDRLKRQFEIWGIADAFNWQDGE